MQQTTATPSKRRATGLRWLRPLVLWAVGWTVACADIDINGPEFPDSDWPFPNDTTGQVRVSWDWRNPMPSGQHIEIKAVSGDIRATTALGSEVVVTATKIGRPGDVAAVSIAVVSHASGVTICALYPSVARRPANTCEPGDAGNMSVWDSAGGSVKVEFAVEVPEGVDFIGRTLAGDIVATELHSDVFAYSMAGDIHISTARLATAITQWGSVVATLGLPDWGRDLEFSTLTGDIRVTIPAATNAVVQATAQAGDITSDFPLTQVAPGRIRGTLGSGGPTLTLSTLAGDVTLKRGG
ncbi:MAG: hypothetical protein JSW71_13170 [Gemmatimonadota bacterium]|nr:MAG: hypothetical protein JSW71_13170 [Gemmatimonadota bacterium]